MKRENGFMRWALTVERALLRLIATSLALTVAAQILLTKPSLRPLLNYAHRAEGIKIDPGSVAVITADMAAAPIAAPARRAATITLEGEERRGASPICVEVDGKRLGTISWTGGAARSITVEVSDGAEVVLRPQAAGAATRVLVATTSVEVIYPARGSSFLVSGGGCRFRAKIGLP